MAGVACVARLLQLAYDRVLGSTAQVVLRHEPSGRFLTDGSGEAPVRFSSVSAAAEFSRRFLDEAPGWRPVPAVEVCHQAA